MATYVLPASRAGLPSIVSTATTTNTYAVPLNAVITEAGSGGGGGATQARVMILS
jgi:hypothetical protein